MPKGTLPKLKKSKSLLDPGLSALDLTKEAITPEEIDVQLPDKLDPSPTPETADITTAPGRKKRRRKGRRSTILTEGLGTTQDQQPKSVLLG